MLGLVELRALTARLTYKPGWYFSVDPNGGRFAHVDDDWPVFTVRARVPDAYHRGDDAALEIESPLPGLDTPGAYLRWVQDRLAQIERHEMDEALRFDDRAIDDPHGDDLGPERRASAGEG